jgi:hypothetical protein
VNATDLALARPEDSVKVTGWYYAQGKAGPNQIGQATATDVSVTLAKPLAGYKKTKPAKAPRAAARDSKLPPVKDPFAPPPDEKK